MRRTYRYAAMTKDEAQHSRWTFYEAVKGYNKHLGDARKGGPPTSREKGGKSYRTGALLLLRHDRGSSSDIASRPGVTATTDMTVLPGVLGCSFDRLRTGSPCDVLFKYASDPITCGCPVAQPSPRPRDTNS